MAGVLRIPCQFTAAGRRPSYNIWHCFTTDSTTADAQLAVDALDAFYTSCAALYNSTTTIVIGTQVVEITANPPVIKAITPGSVTGTGGTAQAPYQLANVVSLRTPVAGRSYRGRVYLGPISDTALNGAIISGALVTSIQNAANTLVATGRPVVWSEKLQNYTVVTSAIVNGAVETQRRRARA